jgi:hypothetical protein
VRRDLTSSSCEPQPGRRTAPPQFRSARRAPIGRVQPTAAIAATATAAGAGQCARAAACACARRGRRQTRGRYRSSARWHCQVQGHRRADARGRWRLNVLCTKQLVPAWAAAAHDKILARELDEGLELARGVVRDGAQMREHAREAFPLHQRPVRRRRRSGSGCRHHQTMQPATAAAALDGIDAESRACRPAACPPSPPPARPKPRVAHAKNAWRGPHAQDTLASIRHDG